MATAFALFIAALCMVTFILQRRWGLVCFAAAVMILLALV